MNLKHAALVAGLLVGSMPANAEDAPHTAVPPATLAEDYCSSFAKSAAETRLAKQAEELAALRTELDRKLTDVRTETEKLQTWIARKEAMQQLASKDLMKIYSGVEPESAATQISKLEPKMAASILRQLNPKRAGEILGIMEPAKAATIVNLIAQDVPRTGGPS